jgi:hypothetical protein
VPARPLNVGPLSRTERDAVPVASVDEIRDLLSWPDVRRLERSEYGMTYVRVVPERSKLPPIEFAFRGDLDFLESFGFGEWHSHPKLDEALVMADDLVRRRKCVLEERDRGNGRYRGSALVGPNDLLGMIGGRASMFRRIFFGEDPVEERIDFSRYVQADHGLVLRAEAEALKRVYDQLGTPIPDWLRLAGGAG